jgi:cell division protein FtsB
MSLDGLRAWIGEVERKLGMRTRVFLVLTVIAIGAAGAGIYLAIDARDSSVSESDVQALQEQLEARIGGGAAGTEATQLEAELDALQAEVEKLKGGGGTEKSNGSNSDSGSESKGTGGVSPEGTSGGAIGGSASKAKLKELLEQAEEQNAQAETGQAER